MLVLQWLVSPVVVCQLISKWWWAGSAVWLLSTSYWTLLLDGQIGWCFPLGFCRPLKIHWEVRMPRCVILLRAQKNRTPQTLKQGLWKIWSLDNHGKTVGSLCIIRFIKYSWACVVLHFKRLVDVIGNMEVQRNKSGGFPGCFSLHSFRFYIAQEIDMPFGEDSNDLPVEVLQHEFNESLLHLSTSLVANPGGVQGLE